MKPRTYKRLRDKAMKNLDVKMAQKLSSRLISYDVALMGLHKARYEYTDMPRELRHESRHWLAERGYGRMSGRPLLPEGVLPGDSGDT